jgi:hypothetical protein
MLGRSCREREACTVEWLGKMKGKIHDVSFVSTVCKPETITERIIKKPVIVDVAQSWVNHVNYCVFLSFM